jgi:uncharacterized protein
MSRLIAAGHSGSVAKGPVAASRSTRWTVLLLSAAALAVAAAAAIELYEPEAGPGSMTLHEAANAGDRDLVSRLLAEGAAIDERDSEGRTPLYMAGLGAMPKMIDKLLIEGADASIRNNEGLTVLHAAVAGGDAEAVTLLVGDGPFAVRVDMNDNANDTGETPVIVAAKANEGAILAHLVTLGADPEIADKGGFTALTHAGLKGYDKVVTILLRLGAECQDIDAEWKSKCDTRKAEFGK